MNSTEPDARERDQVAAGQQENTSQLQPEHRATGPRTAGGKKRSGQNARRHNIFTAGLLDWEGRIYAGLLRGLRDYFAPEGAVEEMLVERLAFQCVCLQRVHVAEKGRISECMGVLPCEKERAQLDEFNSIDDGEIRSGGGLMVYRGNPYVLQRCISELARWRDRIERQGLDWEYDQLILSLIYGERYIELDRAGLRGCYLILTAPETFRRNRAIYEDLLSRGVGSDGKPLSASTRSDLERLLKGVVEQSAKFHGGADQDDPSKGNRFPSPEKVIRLLVERINREIELLKMMKEAIRSEQEERSLHTFKQCLVPERVELLIKYEAFRSREIDRILNHLERLRRGRGREAAGGKAGPTNPILR